jgi:parallel beta-helix repeat protein
LLVHLFEGRHPVPLVHLALSKGSSDLKGLVGILLQGGQSVEVTNNIVQDNCGHGIYATDNNRQRTSGVFIHHNSLRNDSVGGGNFSGVKCEANGLGR